MQLLMMDQAERVTAVVRIPPDLGEGEYMIMATRLGEIKKTPIKNFANVRRDGLIAMDLEAADELVSAKLANDTDDAIMVTANGQAIRFGINTLRSASRLSGGVRGIRLRAGDQVVAMEVPHPGEAVLVVSALGHGKRTPVDDYPRHGRGGQGVITFKTNPKTGELITARMVGPEYELMLVAQDGITLRTPVAHISLQGRATQGVTLMDVGRGDRVAAVAVIDMERDFAAGQELPTGATAEPDDGLEVKKVRRPRAAKGDTNGAGPKKGK
jgi:DNA gyrase subunit A